MQNLIKFVKGHGFLVSVVVVLVAGGAVVAGRMAAQKSTSDTDTSNNHQVSLVKASTFKAGQSTVYADGSVESVSQADLKSQISAPITALYVSVGSTIRAGQTIAVLQNADVRAELDKAKANRDLALGQNASGGVSVDAARLGAVDKIKNAYLQADEAIHTQIDPFVSNNQVGNQQLSAYVSDWKIAQDISVDRIALNDTFASWKIMVNSISPASSNADVETAIQISQKNLQSIIHLLDETSQALTDAAKIQTGSYSAVIDGWKTTLSAVRNSINTANSTLTTADSTLRSAETSNGTPAEAGVALADAGIKALQAQLAKTYITSPITGKIAALPFRVGELVSPGQLVATVVGSGGLEVKAYASSEDFTKLKQGASVMIQDTIAGTLVNIAPSLNETNKKIELKVLINDPANAGLVVGQNVSVSIESDQTSPSTLSNADTNKDNSYFLPIQDVKIVPGSASVYTIDADSKIKDNPVVLGAIRGDFIEVKSGITDDMELVSPVYELNPGETVTVR